MININEEFRNEIPWQKLCLLYEEEFRILNRKISSLEKNMEMSLFQIERLEQENKELERRISSLEKKQNETEEKNEKNRTLRFRSGW